MSILTSISILHTRSEQEALTHILLHHNVFYTPSFLSNWFAYTPVEELAMMHDRQSYEGTCDHPYDTIYSKSGALG